MKINNVLTAKFIKRLNRFIAYVYLNDEEIKVHVPNTGRCREILVPDTTVVLREGTNPNRKTKYDLIAAYKNDKLINIDSQVPNAVVEEALKNKKVLPLVKFNNIKREQTFGNSRFDFKLWDDNNNEYYLEVKGVTLEDNGNCMFPDAPTERGTKHILELIQIKESHIGAGILFLVQLSGAKTFTAHKEMDKKFSEALTLAYKKGVDIFCYDCNVGENYIEIKDPVEIIL